MRKVGQIIVAIGPDLYEVVQGKDCDKCDLKASFSDPCWIYCTDFYGCTGSHFKKLDAVRSHNVLKFLEAQSQQEWGKMLRPSARQSCKSC